MVWVTSSLSECGIVLEIMEDTLLVPVKELPDLVAWYKGELSENALLNKAATVAAKKQCVLNDPYSTKEDIHSITKKLRGLTRKIRQGPTWNSSQGEENLEDDEEDELVTNATEKILKEMVRNTRVPIKEEPISPLAVETTTSPVKSSKKKKKTLSKKKRTLSAEPKPLTRKRKTPFAVKRLRTVPGWEDFDNRRKVRRRLDGEDY